MCSMASSAMLRTLELRASTRTIMKQMSGRATSERGADAACMNAVIIYDDRKLAGEVNAMLEWAAGYAGGSGSWSVRPWRLDLLAQPRVAEAALNEAAEAHIIVLALRSQAEPPAELLEWLETWAGRRHVRDAAVALFDGGAGYTQPVPATPRLSAFADRHGLSFLLGAAGPTE